jgi:hypothetical protein
MSIKFDILWNIMKNPHKDFTSLITEFTKILQKNDVQSFIDILLSHGIYADFTEGNKKYDKDLEAFIDKNND